MKLLDTTFLIDYWAGEDRVETYLEDHSETESFISTTITLKELGVGRALQGRLDPAELEATYGWVTFLPFDVDHVYHAAELEAALRGRSDVDGARRNALAGDLLIAAVAKSEGAPVVTDNVTDFERFDGVAVETY